MSKAFTMVELLLATALAVTLMAGSLHVVASIRADALPGRFGLRDVAPQQLVDVIRWDLTHARRISQSNGRITLTGYGCLDRDLFDDRPEPNQPTSHQPVRVEYFIWQQGDRGWLVRRQIHLTELTNRNSWSELVCGDVAGIELQSLALGGRSQGVMTSLGIEEFALPDRLRLVIKSGGDGGVSLDTLIVLR